MDDARRLAREVADLKRAVRALQTKADLGASSVEGGATEVYDDGGAIRQIIGAQVDGTFTTVDVNAPAPVAPATPTVTSQPGLLIVASFGLTSDGSEWLSDFRAIEVHVGTATGFTPSAATKVAEFGRDGGSITLALDPATYYVKLLAANTSGAQSESTVEVSAIVGAPATLGGVDTYFTAAAPSGLDSGDEGDLWFDTDDGNHLYRWDGAAWVSVQDADIASAQQTADAAQVTATQAQTAADTAATDAANAQTAADAAQADADTANQAALDAAGIANSKGTVYSQPTEPAGDPNGLWIDTDAGNLAHTWDGTAWVATQDADIQAAANAAAAADANATNAQTAADAAQADATQALADAADAAIAAAAAQSAADDAQATADGKIVTFLQAAEPTTGTLGDLWIDTDDNNLLYRHDGTGWVAADDQRISQAIVDAADAQATADSKIQTFFQSGPPVGAGFGDLWFDTDEDNKQYRWDGAAWNEVLLGAQATAAEILAGKRVPINSGMSLEWGIPNPTNPLLPGAIHPGFSASWEPMGGEFFNYLSWTGPGGLVLDGSVWRSVIYRDASYTDSDGITHGINDFIVRGSDDSETLLLAIEDVSLLVVPPRVGLTKIGATWHLMVGMYDGSTYDTTVYQFDANWTQTGSWSVNNASAQPVSLTTDGTDVIFARYDAANLNYLLEARNPSTGALSGTVTISDAPFTGSAVHFERGAFDFGVTRYVALTDDERALVFSLAGVHQAADDFGVLLDQPTLAGGLAWDGTRFVANSGQLWGASPHTDSGSVWAAYTYLDSTGGAESAASPVSTGAEAVGARSGLIFHDALPPDVDETPAPDTAGIYLATSATEPALATLREVATQQVADPVFGVTAVFVAMPFARTADAPPTVSTFPAGAAGLLESELGGFVVKGDGTGAWPFLEKKVAAAAETLYAPIATDDRITALETATPAVRLTPTMSGVVDHAFYIKQIAPGVIAVSGYLDVDDNDTSRRDTGMRIPAGWEPPVELFVNSPQYNGTGVYRYVFGPTGVIEFQQDTGNNGTFEGIVALWFTT